MNILRTVRLQLKSGYLKQEPPSYTFMKRYPPLSRDTAPPVRKIERINIPYLKQYEGVLAKNPMYADERVYPAYWQHEPQALTLAKKQYELMEQGMSEEQAYDAAVKHVETLENQSYEDMKALLDKAGQKDARQPFLAAADPALLEAIAALRAKLKETPYDQLDAADQGEVDHIVQTKVLKWNEVERERRMKDPLFVLQFERLREAVFPEMTVAAAMHRVKTRDTFKSQLLDLFAISRSRLCTAAPFYYEVYASFFAKLKAEPLLGRWNERDRDVLSRWIIDTLALREIVEKSPTAKVQRYLDELRAQFFPMVRYPDRAASFELPSTDEFKAVLHANDVGYKRDNNKLYVKRFYRIPLLLFPRETFTTALLMDRERAKAAAEDEKSLLQEVMSAGLDEASVPELQQQLRDLLAGEAAGMISSDYGVRGGAGGSAGVDMSQLDALLQEADDDDTDDFAADGEADEDDEADKADDEEEEGSPAAVAERQADWDELVKKYVRTPSTTLEKERDTFLGNMERFDWTEAATEMELYTHNRERTENQLIIRARLSVDYERKESARRSREWRRRGVWIEKLPMPALELIDNRSS